MEILDYFKDIIEKNGSDLHLAAGSLPVMRKSGDLIKIGNDLLDESGLEAGIRTLVSDKEWAKFISDKELDFSKEIQGIRFRINVHYQEKHIGMSARLIPSDIPRPEEIGFDEVIYNLTHLKDGLILVTGPSGSGKSTTLAAMIDIINNERRSHIVTIEDPIEFLFKEEQSVIEQREVGTDTRSFAAALKYALRQDPNVIMVGEMRDIETMTAALEAAETGHLVMSTLHTSSAPEAVKRIISIYPASQQDEIRNLLASNLRAVIDQQILPRIDGGLAVAREILISNSAIANLIRQSQIEQIYSVIQTGQKEGMITMNKSIDRLLAAGIISEEVAKNRRREAGTKVAYY